MHRMRSESGIAATEYGVLIALAAVLFVGVVTIFGSQLGPLFLPKNTVAPW